MQRSEIPNNTREQVVEYLRVALEILAEIDPPDDLRATVYNQAAALISGKQIVMMQPQPMDLSALKLGRGH